MNNINNANSEENKTTQSEEFIETPTVNDCSSPEPGGANGSQGSDAPSQSVHNNSPDKPTPVLNMAVAAFFISILSCFWSFGSMIGSLRSSSASIKSASIASKTLALSTRPSLTIFYTSPSIALPPEETQFRLPMTVNNYGQSDAELDETEISVEFSNDESLSAHNLRTIKTSKTDGMELAKGQSYPVTFYMPWVNVNNNIVGEYLFVSYKLKYRDMFSNIYMKEACFKYRKYEKTYNIIGFCDNHNGIRSIKQQ